MNNVRHSGARALAREPGIHGHEPEWYGETGGMDSGLAQERAPE
jgi:hypothetical protein